MLRWPSMVMIGAASRNVGKTEMACELISRYSRTGPIYAVKVTTIRETGEGCPRGGKGCGVCSSLKTPFLISEERQGGIGKDTARMRDAGATMVYWLRVQEAHLVQGIHELRRQVPSGVPVVCESNSARSVIEPGIFLVIREAGAASIKAHCRKVIGFADRVLIFNGSGWSIQPAQIQFTDGCWRLHESASAIILAGGQSRRMQRNKALLDFAGQPLIKHIADQLKTAFPEILIGANDPDQYGFLGLKIVLDNEPGCGPLMGIASCLGQSRHDLNFVTACDIPNQNIPFIRRMLDAADGYDAVIPVSPDGRHDPLFGIYRKTVIQPAADLLKHGKRRIMDLSGHARVLLLDALETGGLQNLNTPEDYVRSLDDAAGVADQKPYRQER